MKHPDKSHINRSKNTIMKVLLAILTLLMIPFASCTDKPKCVYDVCSLCNGAGYLPGDDPVLNSCRRCLGNQKCCIYCYTPKYRLMDPRDEEPCRNPQRKPLPPSNKNIPVTTNGSDNGITLDQSDTPPNEEVRNNAPESRGNQRTLEQVEKDIEKIGRILDDSQRTLDDLQLKNTSTTLWPQYQKMIRDCEERLEKLHKERIKISQAQ